MTCNIKNPFSILEKKIELARYGPSLNTIGYCNPFLKKWIKNEIKPKRFSCLVDKHREIGSRMDDFTGIFFSYPLNKVYEKLRSISALNGMSKEKLKRRCEEVVIMQPTGIYFFNEYKEIFIDDYSNGMLLLTIDGLEEYKNGNYKHKIIKAGSSVSLQKNKFYAFAPETTDAFVGFIMNSYDRRFYDEKELIKFNEVKYWHKLFPKEFAKINS
jgi:hypothetical protein